MNIMYDVWKHIEYYIFENYLHFLDVQKITLNVTVGFHPNLFLAFDASPRSTSYRIGKKQL